MITRSAIAVALLMTGGTAAAVAQIQAAPPQIANAPRAQSLPKDIADMLWPERALAPIEVELRDRAIALRDTIAAVDGVVERLQRLGEGGSAAIARSQGRRLAERCESAARGTAPMIEFAATLFTSDARWGDRAVQSYRTSLDRFRTAMQSCNAAALKDGMSVAQYQQVGTTAREAIRAHEIATRDLMKTLQIPFDPRGARPPVY